MNETASRGGSCFFWRSRPAGRRFIAPTVTGAISPGCSLPGAQAHRPPDLARPGYVYPQSAGYDGQFYRLAAHDPLGRKGYWAYMDDTTTTVRGASSSPGWRR